ncbi:MAG: DUF3604 domain-containing protein [Chloroflexi bacterium]|nr:DUF3604 domain-containing protein [Chloroflexota bacterium]
MTQFDLGKAAITPNKLIVAGTFATITYTYTAGHPMDYAGYLKIAFRNMEDFGAPQFDDPQAPNYCSVSATGGSRIIPRWDNKGGVRPSNKALFLIIRDQYLDRGEQIQVVFGDTSGGSPGWRMPTFCIEKFEFKTYVDPIANYLFKELPDSPTLSIVAGPPVRAVCTAPFENLIGQPFEYFLRLEDCWGNPVGEPLSFTHQGWDKAGVHTVMGKDKVTGLRAESNPIEVRESDPALKKYWADFHGQSGETIGTNTIEDYFRFGRDLSHLDILGHQGNDFQVTDEFWAKVNETTGKFYEPGSFVTFPGYEWSANTPLGGDRNVYFASEGGTISRSSCDMLPDGKSQFADSMDAEALFEHLKNQKEPAGFCFAHVGGRYADLRFHEDDVEAAVEVHSAWGTFEWFLREALERGYRVGFVANSDGHKADPGAAYPGDSKFGSVGGLTCVLAEKLDRESVFQAIKARHFYATSGCRALLDLSLDMGNGQIAMMGDIVEQWEGDPVLHVRLVGSAPVERIDVFNGLKHIHTIRPYGEGDLGRRLKVLWNGARVRGQDRVVTWDGSITVKGNRIMDAVAINSWNPEHPLRKIDESTLAWESFTTGAAKGFIFTLNSAGNAQFKIDTKQVKAEFSIAEIGLEPKVWDLGFLEKTLQVYRLPDVLDRREVEFSLPVQGLKPGDNPIYIRAMQEDGFLIWSSPIYLVR